MSTIMIPSKQRRPIQRVLMYLLSAFFFACLFSIFGPTLYLVQHQSDHHAKDVRQIHTFEEETSLQQIIPLKHENLVLQTIKSCWSQNNTSCKQFVPDSKQPDVKRRQRVGVLTPPGGDISQSLVNRIIQLSNRYNKDEASDGVKISVVHTSHIPPYGYGKNHGYTKLIRYQPDHMVLQVLDMLLMAKRQNVKVHLTDAIAATRLLLRWHCRLSHIAAHTAIASIPLMDFIQSDKYDNDLEAFIFAGPKEPKASADKETVQTGDDVLDDDDHPQDDDRLGMAEAEWAYDSEILKQLGGVEAVAEALDKVILEELELSKNFTVWPCPSFWAIDSLGDIGSLLARELSPDCNDPYVKCFVNRDKCEFVGDAECKNPPAAK